MDDKNIKNKKIENIKFVLSVILCIALTYLTFFRK